MNFNKEKKKPSNENPFLSDEGWELIQDTGGQQTLCCTFFTQLIFLWFIYPNAFDK